MEIIIVIVSGMAGVLIGQANGFFERRHEKRRALNRALTELLEIRHRFKGVMYLLGTLAKEIKMPYAYYDEVISGLPDGFLWDSRISIRYNEAVDIIAMYSPILAYILRSKDVVGFFCNGSPLKFGETKESYDFTIKTISILEVSMTPALEETVESLAVLLGKKSRKKVAELISETQGIPEEVTQLTSQIIESLSEALEKSANKPVHPSADALVD